MPCFIIFAMLLRSATVWLCGCSEVCLRWFMLLLAKDAELLELLIYWDAFLADLKRFELAGDGRRRRWETTAIKIGGAQWRLEMGTMLINLHKLEYHLYNTMVIYNVMYSITFYNYSEFYPITTGTAPPGGREPSASSATGYLCLAFLLHHRDALLESSSLLDLAELLQQLPSRDLDKPAENSVNSVNGATA